MLVVSVDHEENLDIPQVLDDGIGLVDLAGVTRGDDGDLKERSHPGLWTGNRF